MNQYGLFKSDLMVRLKRPSALYTVLVDGKM